MASPDLMERLEGLASVLGGVRPVAAATIREAAHEITELRIALDEARHPGEPAPRLVFMQDPTPETYTYWITFWRLAPDNTYVPGTHKLTRSTPILTCEDRELIAVEMCRDLDTIVILSSVELVKG